METGRDLFIFLNDRDFFSNDFFTARPPEAAAPDDVPSSDNEDTSDASSLSLDALAASRPSAAETEPSTF
jgi:hypothetical protein